MLRRAVRWLLAPIALALAMVGLTASPSGAVTGPNIAPDNTHTYVGLIAFYDAEGNFVHRCSGTLLSERVFLTAGHCVTLDDEGTLAATARIWFEQDAGADYDPVTGTPATSGYPVSGGVVADTFYDYGYRGLTTIPQTHDVGLVILDPGALAAAYPKIVEAGQYADLAAPGTSETLGTGPDAVVDVSGYGVSATKGKNGVNTVSYRSRLGGSAFIISTRNQNTAGYNLQLASNFGNGRVGTCFGDSGGPIFVGGTNDILAVNSWVQNWSCGGQGFAYRVDTAEVQAWMESVLEPLGLWDDIVVA
jgi:Trypsin